MSVSGGNFRKFYEKVQLIRKQLYKNNGMETGQSSDRLRRASQYYTTQWILFNDQYGNVIFETTDMLMYFNFNFTFN